MSVLSGEVTVLCLVTLGAARAAFVLRRRQSVAARISRPALSPRWRLGVPGPIVHAIQSHGDHTGIPRVTAMEKSLYAVDELTGFVTAVALVRPSKAVRDVDATAVRKKMKDKAFARAVSRDMMQKGAEDLGIPFDELVGEIVTALDRVAADLGLAGVAV